jgi:hypothetical protein
MRERAAMYNTNALKVGLFRANCSSGRSATKVPERWSASWPDCLSLARMADEAGIDFMLPIARWKGCGGDTDFHGATLETITWATGLLAATARMTVFGTVHAPLFHPLIAAKALATADHIGEGRLGVNLVVGWNEGEFEMFGVAQREHDMRYDFAQEWLDAVKSAWRGRGLLSLRYHRQCRLERDRTHVGVAQHRAAEFVAGRICLANISPVTRSVATRSSGHRTRWRSNWRGLARPGCAALRSPSSIILANYRISAMRCCRVLRIWACGIVDGGFVNGRRVRNIE